jgi:hypothetical protein
MLKNVSYCGSNSVFRHMFKKKIFGSNKTKRYKQNSQNRVRSHMPKSSYLILAILFIPFGFIASKYFFFNWLYDLSTLSVPDEGYYQKRVVYLLFRSTKKRNLIKANLRNIPATSIRIEE